MYRFERLLVNLSLTETDIPTLKLASLVAKLARSKTVTFVYARESIEIPEPLKREYPWLMAPLEESARIRSEQFISDFFTEPEDCTTELLLKDQSPAVALLELTLTHDIDLVVTGDFDLDRSLAIKLARKAPCSVLLAPAKSSGTFSRVCLGLDLSKYSEYVLDCATAFASAHNLDNLTCVNFYSIPSGFHKTSLPRAKFQQELRELSYYQLTDFLRSHDTKGVEAIPKTISSPVPGSTLLSLSEKEEYDLIVVGCRGKDALTSTLLGSNAEDVLKGAKASAVLAVKEKGTGKTFLESLLQIAGATT
ncbi:universal stress protein [Pelagicoccus mobilis]|uniref:Universal stress protein n=1 Tax=Pelagicoccus mobilis TaxID=415221 RepID=A0A934S588_9BACT|nr:universal stress protein [Pelagicoccus mobilis]MBK1879198.1 universal stress protein [Pelagicoccus mobilis]